MNVKDLQDKKPIDEITLKIVSKEEPREVRGGSLRVCNATGEDEAGDQVVITLWNNDIDTVKQGDKIKITKGWAQMYQDRMQISSGRFGQLEVLAE